MARTLTISGTVFDPSGKRATRGFVMLDGMGHGEQVKGGHFEIGGVEPGRHSVVATIYEGTDPADFFGGALKATVFGVDAGATDVEIHVTGGGNLVVRFHPVGKPAEPLVVHGPSLTWGDGSGGGPSGEHSEIRHTFEPGRHDDIRVEAEGYKQKRLGPIEILPDRKTVIDVELEPNK